jgi:hypothetical protein
MASEEPIGHLVHDVAALAAEVAEAVADAIDECAERWGEMPLEGGL